MRDYIDYENETIKHLIKGLLEGKTDDAEKLQAIFCFVRDDIAFGFHKEADFMTASEIIKSRKGQCNNKSIVMHTLLKAAGIPSRIHFSGISKQIQRGIFKGPVYWLMDKEISHSWVEVKRNGHWLLIDNYINDLAFYEGGLKKLREKGWKTGYSVSCADGPSNPNLDWSGQQFVQMGAIKDDHGIFDDPRHYFESETYHNNPGKLRMFVYRLAVKWANKAVENIRRM